MVTIEKIQDAIIEAIKQSGMKQADLGEKIGVSQSTVAHYLRRRIMPSWTRCHAFVLFWT